MESIIKIDRFVCIVSNRLCRSSRISNSSPIAKRVYTSIGRFQKRRPVGLVSLILGHAMTNWSETHCLCSTTRGRLRPCFQWPGRVCARLRFSAVKRSRCTASPGYTSTWIFPCGKTRHHYRDTMRLHNFRSENVVLRRVSRWLLDYEPLDEPFYREIRREKRDGKVARDRVDSSKFRWQWASNHATNECVCSTASVIPAARW